LKQALVVPFDGQNIAYSVKGTRKEIAQAAGHHYVNPIVIFQDF
jgi:hypothetical protein